MPNNVTVVFDADTQRFRANVDAAGQSVSKSAEAIAAAKNKILDAYNQQVEAAQKNGASSQRLADIQTRAAGSMANVTETNAEKIIRSLDRIADRHKAVSAELGNLKVPEVHEGPDITNRMRASALLRGGGLRAGENFASQFEVFNKIATIAFPVLGLAMLGQEAVKMGKELYDAFDLGGNRARQTAAEVLSVTNALRDSSTSLDVQIDKLQQEQAKLEHKPFNGTKLVLDEAAEAAENLQKKLAGVLEAELKVIGGMSATWEQKLFTGGSDTHQEQVMLQEHTKWLSTATSTQSEYNESVSYGVALHARLNELLGKQRDADAATAAAAKNGQGAFPVTHYDEEIKAVQQLIGWQQAEQANIQKTIDLDKQQAATQHARDTHESGAIRDKAAQAQLKRMEAYVNLWKLQAPVTAKAIYDYWEQQRSEFEKDSNEYNAVVAKQTALAEEGAKQVHEAIAKYKAEQKALAAELVHVNEVPQRNMLGNTPESARGVQQATTNAALSNAEADAQVQKARINIELTTGAISKLSAEQQLAAIDADLHAKRLAALNAQLDELKKSPSYNPVTGLWASDKDQQQAVELQAKIAKEGAAASVDAMKTASQEAADTWQGALKNANAAWIQDAQDSARQITQFYQQAIDGINSQLANAMTGEKTDWSGTFRSLGKTLATDGLKRMEAPVLNALGIAKNDGSDSNPFAVKIVGGGGSFGSGLSKGLSGIFGDPGDGSDDGSDGGSGASGIGSIFSKVGGFFASLFGGGKAVGGGVDAGTTYLVGEAGPELFRPGSSGTIIPNHALGGNHASYTINVANGVTPEQMHMHVQSALRQFHPQVVRDSVAAGRDMQLRTPSPRH